MSRVNDFNRILNQARVKLPGAIDASLKSELFMVVDEFLKDTQMWTENLDVPVNMIDTEYDMVPTLGIIDALISVKTSNEKPVTAAMAVPGVLNLPSAPSSADTYVATVSLTVYDPLSADGLPQFPDWILAQYYPTLLNGLLSRMMAQLAKPYSNAQGAVFHGGQFSAGKAQACINSIRQNKSAGQTWRFPKFA